MWEKLTTEARDPGSSDIDGWSTQAIVQWMNREDHRCVAAVESAGVEITSVIDAIVPRMRRGGRLFYVGAGTSGRLGVLDAAECPPTFRTPPGQIVGIIAGGLEALTRAVEGAEDRAESVQADVAPYEWNANDSVIGIASSGRTPYVLQAIRLARLAGCLTVGIACNADAELTRLVDHPIELIVGPEVLSGSTRLKAGTATKMTLNMISTITMIRLGKTFGNYMVDLRATNEKLRQRAARIVRDVTGLDLEAARSLLAACDGEVKTALVAHLGDCTPEMARNHLATTAGQVRAALSSVARPRHVRSETSPEA